VLALTAPGFDDLPDAMPANTSFVGPILAPADETASGLPELLQPGPPWVLVSLSTTAQHQQEALPTILEAVGALPSELCSPSAVSCPSSPSRSPAT
jgi:hypothetical protein